MKFRAKPDLTAVVLAALWVIILPGCSSAPIVSSTPTDATLPAPQTSLAPKPTPTLLPTPTPTAAPTFEPTPTATNSPTPTSTPPALVCMDDTCIEPGHFFLARPVNGVLGDKIDPTYRYATTRPGTKEVHTGVEMPAAFGEQVHAAAPGKVVAAGTDHETQYGAWKDYYGNLVIIKHIFDGFPAIYSLYAHLSEIQVTIGQEVTTGEVIGLVGASGAATGPHLHFEVRSTSIALKNIRNPELWLQTHTWAGQAGGAILGSVTGPDGLPRKVDSITIQPVDSAGQSAGLATYISTYDKKLGHGDDNWNENFAAGDLPAGVYVVSFVDLGKVWQKRVEVQPGNVSRITFHIELTTHQPTSTVSN